MAASGKALDSGYYNDNVAAQNTINAGKVDVTKAQSFNTTQQGQARTNIAAQVASTKLDQVISAAVSGNSGKVLAIDSTGNVITQAAATGGATIDSTAPTAITN